MVAAHKQDDDREQDDDRAFAALAQDFGFGHVGRLSQLKRTVR